MDGRSVQLRFYLKIVNETSHLISSLVSARGVVRLKLSLSIESQSIFTCRSEGEGTSPGCLNSHTHTGLYLSDDRSATC